jgi:hypothetical protein
MGSQFHTLGTLKEKASTTHQKIITLLSILRLCNSGDRITTNVEQLTMRFVKRSSSTQRNLGSMSFCSMTNST